MHDWKWDLISALKQHTFELFKLRWLSNCSSICKLKWHRKRIFKEVSSARKERKKIDCISSGAVIFIIRYLLLSGIELSTNKAKQHHCLEFIQYGGKSINLYWARVILLSSGDCGQWSSCRFSTGCVLISLCVLSCISLFTLPTHFINVKMFVSWCWLKNQIKSVSPYLFHRFLIL